ncbi:MAG TPA: hypothetical protein VF940_25685, partial [Streptosporangiaceae bacterium]
AGEMRGTWGVARQVPGLARLDKGPDSGVGYVSCLSAGSCTGTVSCASAGNCTVAGWYRPVPDRLAGPLASEPFVVSQVRGIWGTARPVPGFASLNAGRVGGIAALSCTGPGDCTAGGYYTVPAGQFGQTEAFVVDEVHGRWLRAREAPGTTGLNTGGNAQLTSLSCASPGNCAAGGFYTDRAGKNHGLLISEAGGRWSNASPVTGLPRRTGSARYAAVTSVSCAAPGSCAAGGTYPDRAGHEQAFVVDEVSGRWGTAEPVAGIAAVNKGESAGVASISCTSPGDCSAAGFYAPRQPRDGVYYVPFVVSQVHGRWASGRPVPGLAAVDVGISAQVAGLSCASPGNCVAGGRYTDRRGRYQPFVVSQVRGSWGTLRQVPGLTALGGVDGGVNSISCPAAGRCAAAGFTGVPSPKGTTTAAFVVSQN